MLNYQSNLDKLQEMNAKIAEIGGLVNLFATKIEEQEEMIETGCGSKKQAGVSGVRMPSRGHYDARKCDSHMMRPCK